VSGIGSFLSYRIKEGVSLGDVCCVPPFPVAGLVARYQEDRFAVMIDLPSHAVIISYAFLEVKAYILAD
jgi:hypothetical protein